MNIDIQTEHVLMQPGWRHMIDEWATRCARYHLDVVGIDLRLRHAERVHPREQVAVVAISGRRKLRAAKQADLMAVALHGALDALEQELLLHEAAGYGAWRGPR